MQKNDLTPAEQDLIESVRNYRNVSPDSKRNLSRYIEELLQELLDGETY